MSREDIEQIFGVARRMESVLNDSRGSDLLKGKVLLTLFFQASTRTRLSHEAAMVRLGGSVIGFGSPEMTRAGDIFQETLEDTARVVESYGDVAVIRHSVEGAAANFAHYSGIPVINGGDGKNEHPTQALTDMYTILKEKGKIDGLRILFLGKGDARPFHSLPFGLSKFRDVEAYFLGPSGAVGLPRSVQDDFNELGLRYKEIDNIDEVIRDVDVIYMEVSRVILKPKSQDQDTKQYQLIADKTDPKFCITLDALKKGKDDLIVLHPLPRLDELPIEVDSTKYAKYFSQTMNSIPLRMALLAMILGKA